MLTIHVHIPEFVEAEKQYFPSGSWADFMHSGT